MTQSVLLGIVTLHLLMPQVLENHPERREKGVDGYIARLHCHEIGRRYILVIDEKPRLVAVADCARAEHIDYINKLYNGRWIADVDEALWGEMPVRPQYAELWDVMAWERNQRMRKQLERVR